MMYPSNFQKFKIFTMCSNQSTNKIAANDGQNKLTIHDVGCCFLINCLANIRDKKLGSA